MKTKMSAITVIGAGCLMLGGCSYVTKAELSRVEVEAHDASVTADEALATSKQARDMAMAADERSSKTEVIVTRSFKKAMYK